jgi:hypothetical protein
VRGPAGIIGCPGSGKTSLAREMASELVAATGCPLIIVDTGRNELFEDQYHAASLAELIAIVWGEGDHVTWTPQSPEEFEALAAALYGTAEDARARHVPIQLPILLLDELCNIFGAQKVIRLNFRKCLNEWRRTMTGCFVTSQLYHDGGNALKGLCSDWSFHRMIGPDDCKDIRADYWIPPEIIAKLPSRRECAEAGRPLSDAYVHVKAGF